jgi:hypothetical protein
MISFSHLMLDFLILIHVYIYTFIYICNHLVIQ